MLTPELLQMVYFSAEYHREASMCPEYIVSRRHVVSVSLITEDVSSDHLVKVLPATSLCCRVPVPPFIVYEVCLF